MNTPEALAAEIAGLEPTAKLELALALRTQRPDTAWAILEQLATHLLAAHLLERGRNTAPDCSCDFDDCDMKAARQAARVLAHAWDHDAEPPAWALDLARQWDAHGQPIEAGGYVEVTS